LLQWGYAQLLPFQGICHIKFKVGSDALGAEVDYNWNDLYWFNWLPAAVEISALANRKRRKTRKSY
jgi:hypothetical protein